MLVSFKPKTRETAQMYKFEIQTVKKTSLQHKNDKPEASLTQCNLFDRKDGEMPCRS